MQCIRAVLIITMLVVLLSGCSSTRGFPERAEAVPDKLAKLREKFFLPNVDVLHNYANKDDDQEQRTYRDSVVYGRLLALDMQYALFKRTLYEEAIVSNVSLDVLGLLAGVGGAAVTGADASRVLSSLSGGITGTRASINKNLYYERTLPALLALMDAERDRVRAQILSGLIQTTKVYPLGRALTDLERYLQVGSIPGAIASVTATAGETKTEASRELAIIRTKEFVDPSAQKRVRTLLASVDALKPGAAWEILKAPPSPLDSAILGAVRGRLGGTELNNAADLLNGEGNDGAAKEMLKMVVVMMANRTPENTEKWKAALLAAAKTR